MRKNIDLISLILRAILNALLPIQQIAMIRRPLTEITLKLDDLQEYENFRKDQTNNTTASLEMQEDTPKSLAGGTKTAEEIHNRIGYAPKKKPSGPNQDQEQDRVFLARPRLTMQDLSKNKTNPARLLRLAART
ncbi:unnamed protein product [Chilo suppressalis]|uniref:Anaphase-promoting complex subunit CDC26 n=1 Tax=Chilo suppressalis TaxID=168631 RepID=A0ABN8B2M9_CHISP|nr:unnamed protein product [Chilo suppressalis]